MEDRGHQLQQLWFRRLSADIRNPPKDTRAASKVFRQRDRRALNLSRNIRHAPEWSERLWHGMECSHNRSKPGCVLWEQQHYSLGCHAGPVLNYDIGGADLRATSIARFYHVVNFSVVVMSSHVMW